MGLHEGMEGKGMFGEPEAHDKAASKQRCMARFAVRVVAAQRL